MKSKDKRTFIDSLKNCFEGIAYTLGHEKNFRIEIILGILVIIGGFILKVSTIEWIILILLINFVLVLELINTAFEKTVDLYTKEIHPIAKVVKDVASAAVLTMSLFSMIIGVIIFLPKIISLLHN